MQPNAHAQRRKLQLRIEPLEPRRLLAGLTVSVYLDNDASGSFGADTDSPAVHRLVFLDTNRDGRYQPSEPLRATDVLGMAKFDGLDPGEYVVGLLSNPDSQRQTTAIAPAAKSESLSDLPGNQILVSGDFSVVWSDDSDNRLVPVSSPFADLAPVQLPGTLQDWMRIGPDVALLSLVPEEFGGDRVFRFDLRSGQLQPLSAVDLSDSQYIASFLPAISGSETWLAVITDGTSYRLMEGSVQGDSVELADRQALGSSQVVALPDGRIGLIARAASGADSLRIVDPTGATLHRGEVELFGPAQSLSASPDGRWISVELQTGGIQVLEYAQDQLISRALLSQAAFPVAVYGQNLISAAGKGQATGVTVWSMRDWIPIRRPQLSRGSIVRSIAISPLGDQAVLATDGGIEALDLASPMGTPVSVHEGAVAAAQIGVRVVNPGVPPVAPSQLNRTVAEDGSDHIDLLSELGATDADGDPLWVQSVWAPQHGWLEMEPTGEWLYRPVADYHGPDSARIRIYDGMHATDVTLRWTVQPVDDPPQDLIATMLATPEDAPHGTLVGHVSVVDPDGQTDYRITTSDPRFEVVGGQILFTNGWLDYEASAGVSMELRVVDPILGTVTVTRSVDLPLIDVNEPPLGFAWEGAMVAENDPAATIGTLRVIDPDVGSEYLVEVLDPRFEWRDGQLKLVEGVALDYETESTIAVTVIATEAQGAGHEIAQTITISVADANDPPSGIELSKTEVPRLTEGAIVGLVDVADPDGDPYQITVLDERFEVVEGVLKVRDTVTVDESEQTEIEVELIATSDNGDQITQRIPIVVAPPRSPHQNPQNPLDVNGDGIVTPLDALILINDLNRNPSGDLPAGGAGGEGSPIKPDVNGDGILSPLDVLIIINDLNNARGGASEGEYVARPEPAAGAPPLESLPSDDALAAHRRDRELELLIEQIAEQHRER
ncbi:MAG: hypothetical protein D6753_01530 [Planctomycetota bacterium]|nr:MAG: hypothetical protein D6753_01530 [Planctomycetota bacterium]